MTIAVDLGRKATKQTNKQSTVITYFRDEATQLISLKIIKAVAAKLKADELGLLMSHITAFGVHPSASCRLVMYDILMWVYDNYRYVSQSLLMSHILAFSVHPSASCRLVMYDILMWDNYRYVSQSSRYILLKTYFWR